MSIIFRVLMAAKPNVKEGAWGPKQQGARSKTRQIQILVLGALPA